MCSTSLHTTHMCEYARCRCCFYSGISSFVLCQTNSFFITFFGSFTLSNNKGVLSGRVGLRAFLKKRVTWAGCGYLMVASVQNYEISGEAELLCYFFFPFITKKIFNRS